MRMVGHLGAKEFMFLDNDKRISRTGCAVIDVLYAQSLSPL
jgi:hypothetical protein